MISGSAGGSRQRYSLFIRLMNYAAGKESCQVGLKAWYGFNFEKGGVVCTEIPRLAGENAGLRDDSEREK